MEKIEKIAYKFCGCEILIRGEDERFVDRAVKEIKRIIDEEFRVPNKKELKEIVKRDLGIRDY